MEPITENIRLYIIEEQEIYRELYQYVLPNRMNVDMLNVCAGNDCTFSDVVEKRPDVLLLSSHKLDAEVVEELETIRSEFPGIGLVILMMSYSAQDIDMLRKLALNGDGGMALFLKQSLDQVDQLRRTIEAVNQGQVILDPQLASFMFAGKPESPFLKQLTTREMEILGLLAQGYTNAAIAESLFIDIKTVEHHLNSMYSKLKADNEYLDKHLRVSAARLYFETVGERRLEEPRARMAMARR